MLEGGPPRLQIGGMTVTCARCHDHKFDPISTVDYYSLAGILSSSAKPENAASPLMLADKENPADHPVLIRGQAGNHGPPAPRQFLTALRQPDEPRFTDGSGRWELAQRITAPDNPLTARVMVNRIWGYLMGQPLVESTSDFGFRTPPPAIPELLDDLAVEFSQHWSIKRIVRRLVLTRIYRQSAAASSQQQQLDPENRWLARADRKRRDFESLRDGVLQVARRLDRSLGGAPVDLTTTPPNPRRTIYARIDRQNLPPFFRTFDFASPDTHSPGRYYTTVPQQALFLMNNEQMLFLARQTAGHVRPGSSSPPSDPASDEVRADRVDALFRTVLARSPSESERDAAIAFLAQPVEPVYDPRLMWTYGTARVNPEGGPAELVPLPVFANNRYQAAADFPAESPYGHAYLSADGGHPPNRDELGVIRRFTASTAGDLLSATGTVEHPSQQGDGIRAQVWVAGEKRFDQHVQAGEKSFEWTPRRIEAGETIDLVATSGLTAAHDSFRWQVRFEIRGEDGRTMTLDSRQDFAAPLDPGTNQPLDRWSQLAHALMMTNEFVFVD